MVACTEGLGVDFDLVFRFLLCLVVFISGLNKDELVSTFDSLPSLVIYFHFLNLDRLEKNAHTSKRLKSTDSLAPFDLIVYKFVKDYKYDIDLYISSSSHTFTRTDPVKNMTGVFSCLFNGSLVENGTETDRKSIIFLANVMEIP